MEMNVMNVKMNMLLMENINVLIIKKLNIVKNPIQVNVQNVHFGINQMTMDMNVKHMQYGGLY